MLDDLAASVEPSADWICLYEVAKSLSAGSWLRVRLFLPPNSPFSLPIIPFGLDLGALPESACSKTKM